MNSLVRVEPVVADIDPRNIEQLAQGADVIVDGTDTFETRFLLNDFAVSRRVPWVYGGCLGAEGQVMAILPGEGPCLRCLIPDCPPAGSTPTCDTAGILGPTVGLVASLEALEAMKILSGNRAAVSRSLLVVDLWKNRLHQVGVSALAANGSCPACRQGEFPWLAGKAASRTAVLCGRNAVQLTRSEVATVDLEQLEQRLRGVGIVTRNPYLLRLKVERFEITVFPDGRAIVAGTDDPANARTVYAKYIGS
jgi:adenylyltransferase/sulfurtransferase